MPCPVTTRPLGPDSVPESTAVASSFTLICASEPMRKARELVKPSFRMSFASRPTETPAAPKLASLSGSKVP